jgi:hypothetical protein
MLMHGLELNTAHLTVSYKYDRLVSINIAQ